MQLTPIVLESTIGGALVRLEPLADHHFDAVMSAALSDPAIWTHSPYPVRDRAGVERIFSIARDFHRAGTAIVYATCVGPERQVVGSTSIRLVDPKTPSVEIGGTWIVPRWQHTRVNTEAKLLQLTHCFESLGIVRVELKTDARNARSRAAIRRIGATEEGVLTTLGRGGSDYSATILGAAMDASEIIIWTDVDGVLTADPRLVAEARTIPEISYREATELAYFGAKVLHPKTLRAVVPQGIPVWIRNSFAPQKTGTKITPKGRTNGGGVKALTAIKDVTLISLGGPGIVGVPDVVGRTFSTTAEVRANVLLISQSSSQNDICFSVASEDAKRTVEALRKEFAQDLAHEKVEHITVDPNIAIVAVVGENMRGTPGVAGRVFIGLGQENVNIIAIAQGSSESNISFVVSEKDMKAALAATHREFALAGPKAKAS